MLQTYLLDVAISLPCLTVRNSDSFKTNYTHTGSPEMLRVIPLSLKTGSVGIVAYLCSVCACMCLCELKSQILTKLNSQ